MRALLAIRPDPDAMTARKLSSDPALVGTAVGKEKASAMLGVIRNSKRKLGGPSTSPAALSLAAGPQKKKRAGSVFFAFKNDIVARIKAEEARLAEEAAKKAKPLAVT